MSERIVYPLYPHLKGKQILIVDSARGRLIDELKTNLISQQDMVVSVIKVSGYIYGSLLGIMEHGKFDIAVFHAAGPIDERDV